MGENEARYLDVRIIAATNRDLQLAMEDGRFREDLYYRLNTFHLHLPPLRERRPVIPTLVHYFVLKNKEITGKEITELEPAAQYALSKYAYPGNIRELENIVEHAIVLSEGGVIRLEDLPENVQEEAREKTLAISHQKTEPEAIAIPLQSSSSPAKADNLRERKAADTEDSGDILSLEEMERRHILHALSVCKNNKTEVCKKLGISRATLWRKLKELQIPVED